MARKKHDEALDVTETVYRSARRTLLASLSKTLGQMDELYKRDAAEMKRQLRELLGRLGLPAERAARVVDDVLRKSRKERTALIERSVLEGARQARTLDETTFKAVFGEEPKAGEDPLAEGRSVSRTTRTPSLRLVRESEDSSTETD